MQRTRPPTQVEVETQKAAALTLSAIEAARRLGLSPGDTAAILGVAAGAFQSMKKGERSVDSSNGEAERADALVRIVKKLQKQLGDADTAWRAWIRREQSQLAAKPLDVMLQRDGVLRVAQALESGSAA